MANMQDVKIVNGEAVHLDDERTTRIKFENMARTIGCLPEYHQILDKYQGIILRCSNQQERKIMVEMCVIDIHKLFDSQTSVGQGGKIIVGDKVIVEQELKKDDSDGK